MHLGTLEKLKESSFLGIKFDNWVLDIKFLPLFIVVFIFPAAFHETWVDFKFGIFLTWLFEKAVVWSICYFFFKKIQDRMETNGIRKINLFQLVALGVLGGLITSSAGLLLIEILGLDSQVNLIARIFATFTLTISTFICLSVLGRKRREYALRRRGFRKTSIQSRFLRLKRDRNFRAQISKYESNLKEQLFKNLQSADKHFPVFEVMEQIRSFSQGLIDGQSSRSRIFIQNERKLYFRQVCHFLFHSFKRQSLNPLLFAAIIASFLGIPLVKHSPEPKTILITLIYFSITFCCHFFSNKLFSRKVQSLANSLFTNILNILLIVTIDFVFYNNHPELYPANPFGPRILVTIITYIFFCLAGHFAQGSSMLEEHLLLGEIVSETDSKYVERVRIEIQDTLDLKWASYLHNEIQSRFLAILLSEEMKDTETNISEIMDLIKNKTFINETGRNSRYDSIDKNCVFLKGLWESIVVIDFSYNNEILQKSLDPIFLNEFMEVINEIITNAVRHGQASQIRFSFEAKKNGRYLITSTNNGSPYKPLEKGLGTVLLDEVAPLNWKISNSSNLVRTELVLISDE